MPSTLPSYVIDTSVAVKWYVEREEGDIFLARQLLESWGEGRCVLHAPELLAFELANALSSKRGAKAAGILDSVHQLQGLGFQLEGLRWETLERAIEIACSCNATVYDSYFLAMALQSDSVLVTADEAFLRKVNRYPAVVSLKSLRIHS